ncbi:MAG TPA: hypothetical protein PLT92_14120 [Ignavibacteriaceae bacterium]|nr:hypothetical protein [Ignavibacteriaceae bacterium]
MKTFKECFDYEFKIENGKVFFSNKHFIYRTSIDKSFLKQLLSQSPELFPYIYFITIEEKLEPNEIELLYSGYGEYLEELKNNKINTAYKIEEVELIYLAETLLLKKEEERNFDDFLSCIKYSIEHPFFFERLGIDREDWINSIIWQDQDKTRLHPYLTNNIKPNQLGYKIINYLIRNWFLLRYDFDSIRKLKAQLQTEKNGASKPAKTDNDKSKLGKLTETLKELASNPTVPANFLLSIIPTLMILWDNKKILAIFDFTLFPKAFNSGSFTFSLKGKDQIIKCVYNTPEVFFEGLFIILMGIYLYKSKKNPLNRYLISPRLLIGILLGYLAALGGSSYWSMAILSFASNNIFTIILANSLLLLIVFLYIRYEVRKSIGDSDSQEVDVNKQNLKSKINFFFSSRINIRSFNFFRKAVWSSFFIGLLIIDTFFIVYLRNIESAFGTEGFKMLSHRFHTGLIGIIDPVLLLFFFPLALISGVVIKFILDEKPITQPIK